MANKPHLLIESTSMQQKCCWVSQRYASLTGIRMHARAVKRKVEHKPRSYFQNRCSPYSFSQHLFLIIGVFHGSSVADDIGAHQLKRLVELLTSKECEDLLSVLSRPEENIFQRVERLSPETNQLEPRASKPRAKREASTAAGYSPASSETHLRHFMSWK